MSGEDFDIIGIIPLYEATGKIKLEEIKFNLLINFKNFNNYFIKKKFRELITHYLLVLFSIF